MVVVFLAQAVELAAPGGAGSVHYTMLLLIRTYLAAGEPELAMDQIETLSQQPYILTRGWLGIDPTFRSLKGNPRFERLVKGS